MTTSPVMGITEELLGVLESEANASLRENGTGFVERVTGFSVIDLVAEVRRLRAALAQQPDAWTPSGADYDRNIHRNPDAAAWADLFVATFPGLADKHDLMLGWFANAMMAMHDFMKAEQPDAVAVPRELMADMCSLDHDTRIQAERRLLALLAGGAE